MTKQEIQGIEIDYFGEKFNLIETIDQMLTNARKCDMVITRSEVLLAHFLHLNREKL